VVNNAGIQHVSPVEEFPEEKFRQILALMLTEPAVKRLVEPAEVGDLAVLLCGPQMSFANGSSFVLDGGWTAE
jgi:3-hydroxybutyrate dehydrogenase